MSNMKLSPNGAAFIRLHEGFRSHWYRDATGTETIGIGFTWGSVAFIDWYRAHRKFITFGPDDTMTEAEADAALIYVVEREYGKAVNDFLGKSVPQHVFDAMCSAVFNLGPGALKWKWAAAAKAGDYSLAASYLRKTGTKSKGVKLKGLVRRRKEEAILLETGAYTGVDASIDNDTGQSPNPLPEPPVSPEQPKRGNFLTAIIGFVLKLLGKVRS